MKSKDIRKRSLNYSKALLKAPKLENGELAIMNHKGFLKKINPLDVKVDGVTYNVTLQLKQDLLNKKIELESIIREAQEYLVSTLKENGYESSSIELKELISEINQLKIIKPTIEYVSYVTDSDGYVIDKHNTNHILELSDIPEDWNNGYWKIIDDKWVLDNDKFEQYWSVI